MQFKVEVKKTNHADDVKVSKTRIKYDTLGFKGLHLNKQRNYLFFFLSYTLSLKNSNMFPLRWC